MSLTLAGVELLLPTTELCRWVRNNIPVENVWRTLNRAWPGPGNRLPGSLALGYPLQVEMPPYVEVNQLHWRQGLSRYAYGYFLCSREQLARISKKTSGSDGLGTNPVTLRIASDPATGTSLPTAEAISVSVYVLPPQPLTVSIPTANGDEYENGLFLLPVVDPSYYFWGYPCPAFGISGQTAWAAVIQAATAILPIALPFDDIPATYLYAHPKLNCLQGQALPPILDTLALNVGQRIIRRLDGTFAMINSSSGLDIRSSDDTGHSSRSLRAGGDAYSSLVAKLNRNAGSVVPGGVNVAYRGTDCGQNANPVPLQYSVSKHASDYTTYTGSPAFKIYQDLCSATYSSDFATNVDTLNALTDQIAKDTYGWMTNLSYDRVYNGVVAFAADGFTDDIIFTYRAREFPNGAWWFDPGKPGETDERPGRFIAEAYDAYEFTTRAFTKAYNGTSELLHHTDGGCVEPTNEVPICGEPAIVTGKTRCLTAWTRQKKSTDCESTYEWVKTGENCGCVTLCCSTTTTSSSATISDPCPTDNCSMCGTSFPCDFQITISCLTGGADCGTGTGTCPKLQGIYYLSHVPGHYPNACTWSGHPRPVGDPTGPLDTNVLGTFYYNGSAWQFDLVGYCNSATFKTPPTTSCFTSYSLTLNPNPSATGCTGTGPGTPPTCMTSPITP